MKKLGIFLFGIIFYELIFPTLEELFGWIMAIIKVKQGTALKKYTELQKDIVNIQKDFNAQEEPKGSTFAMGFQINNPEDEEWEEEEDE